MTLAYRIRLTLFPDFFFMKLFRLFIPILIITITAFIKLQAQFHLKLIIPDNHIGEKEVAWRIKIASERLGWVVTIDENEDHQIQHQ